MKKAIIMCAAGMSSSLMAKKTTEYFQANGHDIHVDATIAATGQKLITEQKYDLYLISPQAKMYFEKLKVLADKAERPMTVIPINAYNPLPKGIEALANLILEHIWDYDGKYKKETYKKRNRISKV